VKPRSSRFALTRGFTLIELLVVMTMTTLIALAMAGSMQTMAQTETRIDERLQRLDDYRVSMNFLRSTLGRVSSRKLFPVPTVGVNQFMFVAEPEAITWVGVMPARHGAGGLTAFKLKVEAIDRQAALVLRFFPIDQETVFPDWTQAESRVLVDDVQEFSVNYQDARQTPLSWLERWTVVDRLPSRVKLQWRTSTGQQADLVVPMRSLGLGRLDGFTFGGSE
jgi:general secretion pathway protein J